MLDITAMEVATSIYTQSKEGRKNSGESCNRFTRALTNSHTCTVCNKLSHEPAKTNQQQKLKYIILKTATFLLIQHTLNLIKTTSFLLMRNGGILFNSSFVFSYKSIRHRFVESSRWSPSHWSSFFFLMVWFFFFLRVCMFWASSALSIVMSFKERGKRITRWWLVNGMAEPPRRCRDDGKTLYSGYVLPPLSLSLLCWSDLWSLLSLLSIVCGLVSF